MDHDLITAATSVVVGVISSYLTFRLQFERHRSMDTEREKHWSKWRDKISDDVEELKRIAGLPKLAELGQRVTDVERRLTSIEHTIEEKLRKR